MPNSTQNKVNQHVLPKLYLKGFSIAGRSEIWVYDVNRSFTGPGRNHRPNPIKRSVNKHAGVIKNFYSLKHQNGMSDPNTIENQLEKLEKPADRVLTKIRNLKIDTLTVAEKRILAEYINHFYKRLPIRFKEGKEYWNDFVARYTPYWLELLRKQFPSYSEPLLLKKLSDYVRSERAADRAILESMAKKTEMLPEFVDILLKKEWLFMISPDGGQPFITSDNPVWFQKELGVRRSEVIFPVGSRVVLQLSAEQSKRPEQSRLGTPQEIQEINKMIGREAFQFIYCEEKAPWVLQLRG